MPSPDKERVKQEKELYHRKGKRRPPAMGKGESTEDG